MCLLSEAPCCCLQEAEVDAPVTAPTMVFAELPGVAVEEVVDESVPSVQTDAEDDAAKSQPLLQASPVLTNLDFGLPE
eukprot:m.268524 g.268524  ORF g.268524 m.268524 type:complete len:78 (-) comp54727_c0_seq6:162-395(-)